MHHWSGDRSHICSNMLIQKLKIIRSIMFHLFLLHALFMRVKIWNGQNVGHLSEPVRPSNPGLLQLCGLIFELPLRLISHFSSLVLIMSLWGWRHLWNTNCPPLLGSCLSIRVTHIHTVPSAHSWIYRKKPPKCIQPTCGAHLFAAHTWRETPAVVWRRGKDVRLWSLTFPNRL